MNTIRRQFASAAMIFTIASAGISVPRAAAQPAVLAQKTFASPQEGVEALRAALKANDDSALRNIFGPDFHDLLTGDKVQDKANSLKMAKAMENAHPLAIVDGTVIKVTLEIGAEKWPFPIPLVKESSVWRFDTEAGRQEIVDRHVGKDEYHAIGVCEAYVVAQKKYVTGGRGSSGAVRYAGKFMSTPGKMDGLYWKTESSEIPSPFGARMAAAGVDGNPAPKPYHGYFFRVLTDDGAGTGGGFALVAYPEHWGRSGIMTFIVNQDGKIYQRDLGEKTSQLAAAISKYDPNGDWSPVKDHGVQE
jgi:DUF2950 family protein